MGVKGIVMVHVVTAVVLTMVEKIVKICEICAYERSVVYEWDVRML